MICYFFVKGDCVREVVIVEGFDIVICFDLLLRVYIVMLDMKIYCLICKCEGYIVL